MCINNLFFKQKSVLKRFMSFCTQKVHIKLHHRGSAESQTWLQEFRRY
jgi:hypothetical protein